MGMNAASGMMQGVAQNNDGSNPFINTNQEDPYTKLANLKQLLDQGVITQEDFDKAKNQLLGI